ncbi:FUN14 family-domain-containing protein [Earliella scabrosa]|nr:FUN14 family-domain-containing protein [Earliella scabrosa]
MLPILPSLLSRPLCGTVRRAPCLPAPYSGVTKTYFTPNRAGCGCARRPYVQYTRSSSLSNQPRSPAGPRGQISEARCIFRIVMGGVGLALTFLAAPVIYCDPVTSKTAPPTTTSPPPPTQNQTSSPAPPSVPPPPQSSVNFYELTFGTVCGLCAGVFVKKGARMVAFTLGGVFVLLQYLGSLSLVRVDWSRAATRFENLFYTKDAAGVKRPPNVGSLFRWIIDFLTADFQPRASFIAGFGLGLRIG